MKATQEQLQKSVCVLPWIHLNIWTDGRIIPCCINQETLFGHTKKDAVEKALNSEVAVNFRKKMLSGTLPESCRRCKMPENELHIESYRTSMNAKYIADFERILSGQVNEYITDWNIKYLDVRYSNLCNFSCLTCDTLNSSGVAQDYKKLNRLKPDHSVVQNAFNDPRDFYSFVEKNIHSLQEIYFCGGEPLLLKEHYDILNLLIKNKKTEVEIRYNSNMSNLSYSNFQIVDFWKQFKNVNLGGSLDASGARAEYMRKGTKWEQIEKNRALLKKEVPHIYFYMQPTVQLMNSLHLPDFHLDWIDRGWAEPDSIYFNILTDPEFYSLKNLPGDFKIEVAKKWKNYQNKLIELNCNKQTEQQINGVISYLNTPEHSTNILKKFGEEILTFDKLRNTDFKQIFPEFEPLFQKIF